MLGIEGKRFFGLNIGASAVKLIEAKRYRDGFRFTRARLVELDIDPISDDTDKINAVVKEALEGIVKEENIRNGKVAVSVSGQSVFLRSLKVPKAAKGKIEQIIQYEAQLQVPFPISDVIWDYEVFESDISPEMEVALIAIKKEIVEGLIKLIEGTGLGVDYVDVGSFSLYNAASFIGELKGKIILDIGGRISDLVIVEENNIWARSILIGGNDFTRAISSSLSMGFKEAEACKRKEGIVIMDESDKGLSPHAAAISEAINPVLVELLTDVSKSIGYYKSQFGKTGVLNELILTGGGAKLRNIGRFIRENLDLPTRTLNLWENVKEDLDFEVESDMVNRFDVAMGLALKTVTPLATSINLLPSEILNAKEFEGKKWYVFASLAAAIMIFLTLTGFVMRLNRNDLARLAKASTIVERYSKYQKEIAQLQDEINGLKAYLDLASDASMRRFLWLEIYNDITAALPDNLWLTEAKKEGDSLAVKGLTNGTFDTINQYKESLAGCPRFAEVNVQSADIVGDDKSGELKTFSITMKVRPSVPAGPPAVQRTGRAGEKSDK